MRDNLNETAVAKATTAGSLFVAAGANSIVERTPDVAGVDTDESTTSTSFTNLATVGPGVTATSSASAMVVVSCLMRNSLAGDLSYMSYEVTGASSTAAVTSRSLVYESSNAADRVRASYVDFQRANLNAGSNVFTAKYRVSGGTGNFADRRILVIPL